MIDAGMVAPDVRFATADGVRSLNDYRGKLLVLYFYPKDDTTGCTAEAIAFTDLIDKFTAAGAAIVGISRDTLAKHAKFATKYGLRVELGSDEVGQVTEAFGVWAKKSLYGREYMGIERTTFLIDREGRVVRVWRKVKVKGHAEQVLEAVRALSPAA